MRFALIAHGETATNRRLLEAVPNGIDAALVRPNEALASIGPGDTALARLDVLPTLDGIEQGTWDLARLEAEGILVLNRLRTLLSMHDKLLTARILSGAGIPHPRTRHISHGLPETMEAPFVLKPRFGSWGSHVHLCRTRDAARRCLDELSTHPWFRKHGVLAQELVPPIGRDLRIVVAGGSVVGAVERHAAPGEWRTNVALGGVRRPAEPPLAARELALSSAAAAGAELVGIDLLPTPDGGWTVLELNGAVEFNEEYSLDRDVYAAAADALVAVALGAERKQLAVAG
jgi:RimK family alpha-L-glutamate ligase